MIKISWTNDAVDIEIEVPYPTANAFILQIKAGTGWANRLLGHTIREALWYRLMKVREVAYAEGWKDAKAKRAKRKHFAGGW